MATEVGTIPSVEDLLARAKAAAATKKSTAGLSKVQQFLAGTEIQDTVQLSPVAKLLQGQSSSAAKKTPYTEQDWYINAKVSQLKGQISLYSTLPGLDPSGAIMDSLTKEVNALVSGQQAKLKASTDEAAKKQEELKKLEAEKADAPKNADALLKNAQNRANGIEEPVEINAAVKAMLDRAKGAVVDKKA